MRKEIKLLGCDSTITIDEDISLVDIERAEPKFFSTKFGKRETYTMYRGQLICRHTVTFTGCKPERRTTAYLFDAVGKSTFCISGMDLKSIGHAKGVIDQIIEQGWYSYGMKKPA